MRPETANRIIRQQIKNHLNTQRPFNARSFVSAIDKRLEVVIRDLRRIEAKWGVNAEDYSKQLCLNGTHFTPDDRTTLMYYSDRFNAPHRLWWLREMVSLGYFNVT